MNTTNQNQCTNANYRANEGVETTNYSPATPPTSQNNLPANLNSFKSERLFFQNKIGLMKYKEAAQYLGISESYLRRLKQKGKIPAVGIGKRGIRFKLASLDVWISKQEKQ